MNLSTEQIQKLKDGGIAVIPTDTVYGIVAPALNEAAVERLYAVRKRTPTKPFIVLIAEVADLSGFGITLSSFQQQFVSRYWPNALSIIFSCTDERLSYLHRGTRAIAFRLPNNEALRNLLAQTGPLVAPSANPEGLVPAATIAEAQAYFGDTVDFYIDGGKMNGLPSTLVSLVDDKLVVLRQGVVEIAQ